MRLQRTPLLTSLALLAALGPACQCGTSGVRSRAPHIEVNPASAVFPPIAVGQNEKLTLQITNTGNDSLHFQADPVITESDNDGKQEFSLPSILTTDCDNNARTGDRKTIDPGQCALLVVRYEPADDGNNGGDILLSTDDPDQSQLHVPIKLGDPAKLKICTLKTDDTVDTCDAADGTGPTLDYGLIAKGQSQIRKIRLINDSTVKLESILASPIAGPFRNEYSMAASQVPTSLDVGAHADFQVRFTPTGGGSRNAYIDIASSDSKRASARVYLSGTSEGPGLCVTPSPIDFGDVNMGSKKDIEVTLKSCGTVPVQLQAVSFDPFTDPAFDTVPKNTFPGSQTLQPNATITMTVRMQPQEPGAPTGLLLVPNDGQPGQYVEMKGQAVDAPICRLRASVTSVDFGQVATGQSTTRQVSVANAGKADCHLTGAVISLNTTYFSVQNPGAVTLHPNDALVVNTTFTVPAATATGQQTGKLTFNSDDPVNPASDVTLTGQVVASPECKLSIQPTGSGGIGGFGGRALNYGTVLVGTKKVLPVSLRNIGSANCTLSNIRLTSLLGVLGGGSCSNSNCNDFSIVSPLASGTLQPGQNTQVNIQYAPQSLSSNGASNPLLPTTSVFIDTNAPTVNTQGQPECSQSFPPDTSLGCVGVGLGGDADISNLSVLPSDVDFGLVTLGCNSNTRNVTLYNTGRSAAITISALTLDPPSTTGPFFITAPPTPFTINAGKSVTITIKYRPTGAQVESAQLRISNNAGNTAGGVITVGLKGTGTTDKHQVDTFTQTLQPQVDLLFVIDNSGSMQDYQSSLSQEAPKFIQQALAKNVDYQFGVTTTDADVDGDEKTDNNAYYQNQNYYIGGLFGQPPIVVNSTPNAADAIAHNIRVGTCCSDSRESGLESAWDVLRPNANQTNPPQGSKGFLRDAARLVMLNLTDEHDQSTGTAAFYTDFFQQLKGQYNAGLVSWNTISGDTGTGCNANGISAEANDLGWAVAKNTGGKTYSLCSADWGVIANDLALDSFNGRKQFALSRVADPSTIQVTMNGTAQTNPAQYTFDQPSNSVIFVTAPPPGATIVVNYDALCF
ncbi:MAG: choice-of-anchor D domain-containing protein [Deltaproteobacteria bacterium]|nr:choice-of-anchor D domain-containing protein [Deltaproteobacteria bacterium]